MTEPFISGWRNILKLFGLRDAKALRKYADRYSMPIRRLPSGRPIVIVTEIETWLVEFDERWKKLEGKKVSNNTTSLK